MISIIIPVYNQHEITNECINAVLNKTSLEYEIIVIDNGSKHEYKPPFTGFNEIRVIRNEKNEGFPKAVNQGIQEAKGDIIVLLNNDVIATPDWDIKLYSAIETGYDIVGPVTNYCAGVQKVQIADYEDTTQLDVAANEWAEGQAGNVEDVNFIIGFCMMFKACIIEDIGLFDDTMWPCSGEEVDFCFRAIERGYRIGIVNECYVHHEGSQTFQALQNEGIDYRDVCKKDDDHIEKKWGKDYWSRQVGTIIVPKGVCLNLGCGYRKLDGFTNIDYRKDVDPDLCCDVIDGLPFEDNSVDYVKADDFLEHIPIGKTVDVVTEIWRVLKPRGIFESCTPDAEYGQGAFQNPTHVSFWVKNSWLYYSDKASREFYGIKADFEISEIERIDSGVGVHHIHVIAKKRGTDEN